MMKKPAARYMRSTFVKYLASYLLLVMLLLICFTVYVVYRTDLTLREEAATSSINKMDRICAQNEEYLTTLLKTAEQIGASSYITPFSFSEEPWKAYDLLRQLSPYAITNDFCDQQYVLFAKDNYLYSSASSIQVELFAGSLMRFEHTTPAELKHLLYEPGKMTILPVQKVESSLLDGSGVNMVVIAASFGTIKQDNLGTLLCMIRESTYLDMFRDKIADNTTTCVVQGDKVLVADRQLDIPDETLLAELERLSGDNRRIFSFGGQDYLLAAVGGTLMNLRYLTVLPLSGLQSGVLSGLGRFLLVVVLLLVLCIPVILVLARRSYKPVRQLRTLLDEGPQGAGEDDFERISEGITVLKGRNQALNQQVFQTLPMQRNTFVLDFMKGRYPDRDKAVKAAAALGLNIDKRYFAVLLSGVGETSPRPVDLTETELGQAGFITGYGVEMLAYDQHLYLLFADEQAALRETVNVLLSTLRDRGCRVAVAISDMHEDFREAGLAYLQAATAYDNRLVMGDAQVLRFTDVNVHVQDVLPQAHRYASAISQAVRMGTPGQVNLKIDDLLHFLRRTRMSLFGFRLIYSDVLSTLLSMPGVAEQAEKLQLYDIFTLTSCQSIDDLDGILRDLCSQVLTTPEQTAETPAGEGDAIASVLSYLGEHYCEPDLTMSSLAEQFGLSQVRLSVAFKDRTSISPSDYLLMLRMEKAKQLLGQTEETIKDISAAVGYYDPSGFIRRFKQYTAMTPLQYRQSLKESQPEE